MLRTTKKKVIDCLENVLRLQKAFSSKANERTSQEQFQRDKTKRTDLAARLFIALSELVVYCDREVSIEPSNTNTQVLIASCRALQIFFDNVVCRFHLQPQWENFALDASFTEFSFTLSRSIINQDVTMLEKAREDLREHAEDQMKMRERTRRISELIDIEADLLEDEKEMSLEEAIMIIQKIERVYQATSRYNYLRHVYQRAMDIREGGTTMTPEEAIVRIQARTRGIFARKRVREMRQKELDLLGLSTGSLLSSMEISPKEATSIPSVDMNKSSLEMLLQDLKDHFYPPAVPEDIPTKPIQRKADTEDLYHELCLRRVIRDIKRRRLSLEHFVSEKFLKSLKKHVNCYRASVAVDGNKFEFDIRLFLNCSFVIPLALRGWHLHHPKRWVMLTGSDGAGKTAWTEAVAEATGAVHIRVSPSILTKGRRRTAKSIVRFLRADHNSLVSIDRLEQFKPQEKTVSASLNLMKMLLTDLASTNAFVIGMSRLDEIHPSIQELFTHFVKLEPLRENNKIEVIGRFLSRTQATGRLQKIPEKLSDLRRKTTKLNCGHTAKAIRIQLNRAGGNV